MLYNTAVIKNWTAKWPYIANAVSRIVQNHGEQSSFRRFWGVCGHNHPLDLPLMWHLSYYLYYEDVVSLTTLSVQLRIYATNCMTKCIHPVVLEAGVQAHPRKFWFVENPRKIHEKLDNISENPNKSLIYLGKIPENLGNIGAQRCLTSIHGAQGLQKNKWRPFLLRSRHKTGRQNLHDNFLGKILCTPKNLLALTPMYSSKHCS